jgi:hypothetical protein
MRPSFKTVSTAALGLAMAFSAGAPAIAFPLTPVGAKSPTLVETVQYRSDRDRVWARYQAGRHSRHARGGGYIYPG